MSGLLLRRNGRFEGSGEGALDVMVVPLLP